MLIFIDFDDVLFNTKSFKKDLIKVFLKNGITKKDFFVSYYDYPFKTKKGLQKYDPWNQIKILKTKKKFNEEKLKNDLAKLLGNLKRFIFSDSRDFLKKFKRRELVLVSYGETKFQEMKINSSSISPYFAKIIIGDKDKAELIKKFLIRQSASPKLQRGEPAEKKENIFLLEDFPLHINAVKQKLPQVKVIRLRRKEGRYSKWPSLKADFEVKDLKEAEKIIKNTLIACHCEESPTFRKSGGRRGNPFQG